VITVNVWEKVNRLVNKPKGKGTFAETAVVRYLNENGWPHAENRRLRGRFDPGDITGCPGLCIEVKYAGGNLKLPMWLRQTETERQNTNADYGILVIKPPGLGIRRTGQWYAAMYAEDWERLLFSVGMTTEMGTMAVLGGNEVHKLAEHMYHRFEDGRGGGYRTIDSSVLIRGKGIKDPKRWYRVTTLGNMVKLLRLAGYGSEPDDSGKLSHNVEDLGVADEHAECDRAGGPMEREP
jgi:hypothetical protein